MIRDTADTPNANPSGALAEAGDASLHPAEPGQPQSALPMRVLERGVYRGANLFTSMPMIRIQVDLGALEEWPSNRVSGFNEGLLKLLPGLGRHGCSYKEPGGFVRRLEDGTWLGHVAEHVALELQSLIGPRVTRGKTRSVKGKPGVYNVMFAYEEETVGLLAGRLALQLVDSLLPPGLRGVRGLDRICEAEDPITREGAYDLNATLDQLQRQHRRVALGPTTQSLVREAERRGIPAIRLDDKSLVQLGTGRHQKRIRASITSQTSQIATDAAGDKDLTKQLLRDAGLPVPRGVIVRRADDAVREASRIGYPVVTKPLDGNHGRGVSIGLATPEAVRDGFEEAARHGRRVIVEQQYQGRDHRILVVNGEVIAVAERVPAHVVGDGSRSITELVDEVNRDPRRGDGHENVMTRIRLDSHVRGVLAKAELSVDSVPARGQVVYLCDTANLSTGGTAIDRTDDIHPDNAMIARRAARTIGLDIAGIDFMAPDITRSVHETGGGIIEVNAAPGFRMHLQPSQGRARNVARMAILIESELMAGCSRGAPPLRNPNDARSIAVWAVHHGGADLPMPTLCPPPLVHTERLVLRRPVTGDAQAIFERYAQDPETVRYMTWRPHNSIADTREFLGRVDESWSNGSDFSYVMCLAGEDAPFGMIGIHPAGFKANFGTSSHVLSGARATPPRLSRCWPTGF